MIINLMKLHKYLETLILKVPKMNMIDFAKSADPSVVVHNESPHQDLHFSLSSLVCK